MAGTVIFVQYRIRSVTGRVSANPAQAALLVLMDRVDMTPEQRANTLAAWNKWSAQIQLSRLQATAISNKPTFGFVEEISQFLNHDQKAKLDTLINDRIRAVNPSTLSKMFAHVALTWKQKAQVDDIFARHAAEITGKLLETPEAAGKSLLLSSRAELNEVLDPAQQQKLSEYIDSLAAPQ